MPSNQEVFDAIIKADDQSSSVLEKVQKLYGSLGHEIDHVGEKVEHLHHGHMHLFGEMREHVDVLKEHTGELVESYSKVGEAIAELIPAFAAFGAASSAVALFETTERVSEAYGELAHVATTIGTSAQNLHVLQTMAKLTDTDIEGMSKSVERLNRVFGEVMGGKAKDTAELLHHLNIDPASFHDATEALPRLADAFEHTESAAMRSRMAFTLFGKSGQDLIPLLSQGGERFREHYSEAQKLSANFTPYGEGLDAYNEHMKQLGVATTGFTDLLGGKLAPVLDPLIQKSKDYVLANREWMTDDIAGGVKHFADALQTADWKAYGDDFHELATAAGQLGEHIKGVEYAVAGLTAAMALKGVVFFGTPIAQTFLLGARVTSLTAQLSGKLVRAWWEVGAAATVAGEAELAAASITPVGGAAAGAAGVGAAVAEGAAVKAATKAGLGSRLARYAGLAASIEFLPAALAGYDVHLADSDDGIGKWIDRKVPGAGAIDDFFYRHTGGSVGRPWAESHPVEAGNLATPIVPPGDAPAWRDPQWLSTAFVADAFGPGAGSPGREFDFPSGFGGSLPSGPSFNGAGPRGAPGPAGDIVITVNLPNAPPGALVETAIRGNLPEVRTNLGEAFGDMYGH